MRHAIDRFVAGGFALRLRHHIALVLLLLPLGAMLPDPARADDNRDAANTAVDLFVKAGQAAGVPINDAEVGIVKSLVGCGVANNSDSGIGNCVKQAAIGAVLQQAGLTDQTTKDAVTGAINCMTGQTDPGGCAAQIANSVLHVPEDAKPAVTCILTGGSPADCATKLAEGVVLDKIPAQIQPVAKCAIAGGNVAGCIATAVATGVAGPQFGALANCAAQPGANLGQCAGTFAANNLPTLPKVGDIDPNAAVKGVVGCVGNSDFDACVTKAGVKQATDLTTAVVNQAGQQAIQAALDQIQKLQPTAAAAKISSDPGVTNLATLRNILMVADGIKRKDYSEVLLGGGTEVAILASQIILDVFLPGGVGSLLAPAVQAMIHNDEAAAQKALDAASRGDAVGLAQVFFEWYATQFIDKPCALLGDNDVTHTVCGAMSDAIQQISTWGGDVAKWALGAIEDILDKLGIWKPIDAVATAVWNGLKDAIGFLGGLIGIGGDHDDWKPPADCAGMSPKGYFGAHYLTCISRASNGGASLKGDVNGMNATCANDFLNCVPPDKRSDASKNVTQACGKMGDSLQDLANQVSAAKGTAADLYAAAMGPAAFVTKAFAEAQNEGFSGPGVPDFCSANFWDGATRQAYANTCGAFVNKQFPPSPAGSCALPNYSPNANASCLASLDARLGAFAAQGKPLTGPGSDYCKAQQQYLTEHDCKPVVAGSQTVIVGGKEVTLTSKWECSKYISGSFGRGPADPSVVLGPKTGDHAPSLPFGHDPGKVSGIIGGGAAAANPPAGSSGISTIPMPGAMGHGPVIPQPLRPGQILDPPPRPLLKPPVSAGLPKGGGGSSGVSTVNGCSNDPPAPGCPPKKKASPGFQDGPHAAPIIVKPPKGGSSGVSTVNGCSGNSPAAGCPNAPRQTPGFKDGPQHTAPIIAAPKPPAVSSSGTNSAMDRLGGGGVGHGLIGGGGANSTRKAVIPVPPPRNDPNDLHVR